MRLDKAITSRKSVREYTSKKPDWRKIIEAIDAARYAPMAGNNFTLKFILIDDTEKINSIAESCQQNFISKAKYVVAVYTNPKLPTTAYGKKEGMKYNHQQAGAAIQNFLLKLEQSKLATCWVGYFVESQIKKLLEIPEDNILEAIFPIGYENDKPKKKRMKVDIDKILYFGKHGNKKMNPVKVVRESA